MHVDHIQGYNAALVGGRRTDLTFGPLGAELSARGKQKAAAKQKREAAEQKREAEKQKSRDPERSQDDAQPDETREAP